MYLFTFFQSKRKQFTDFSSHYLLLIFLSCDGLLCDPTYKSVQIVTFTKFTQSVTRSWFMVKFPWPNPNPATVLGFLRSHIAETDNYLAILIDR